MERSERTAAIWPLSIFCLLFVPVLMGTTIFKDGFEGDPIVIPPNPEDVAPPNPESGITDIFSSTEFLYTGDDPIQTGVASETIESRRVAVIRGRVNDRDGGPLAGVAVSILGHPEFGQTFSRADGRYDLAVNGGGKLTLNYTRRFYLPAQRRLEVPWRDWVVAPDVALVALDPNVTSIDLASPDPFQVVRGSMQSDVDGNRRGTLLVPQGTVAELVLPDGSTEPISQLNVRATEYTVGPNGPQAMPAELPPISGYTYAVELSADEAFDAGANEVRFNQPSWFYVENFIGFPTGQAVPAGYYDRASGRWLPSDNGRVIEILSTLGGEASIDVDGDGVADSGTELDDLGITQAELQQLAQLYGDGASLWRIPVEHFTPWDCNWPYGPPDDATAPPENPPEPDDRGPNRKVPDRDDPCKKQGSIIECQSRTLRKSIAVAGTPVSLNYRSDRFRRGAISMEFVASGDTVPASLGRIEVQLEVAGRLLSTSVAPAANQTASLEWDGKDAYGRDVLGSVPATARVIYWYEQVYYAPGEFEQSFGRMPSGSDAIASRDTGEVGISRSYSFGTIHQGPLGVLDARTQGLGGWTLNLQHAYDAQNKTLFMGDGTRREQATGFGDYVIDFVDAVYRITIGGQTTEYNPFDNFRASDVEIAADGTIWVTGEHAVQDSARLVRVQPDGDSKIITQGTGRAWKATLHPDGALYYTNQFYGIDDIPTILRYFDPDPLVDGDEQTTVLLEGLADLDDIHADDEGGLYFTTGVDNQVFYIPPNDVGPDPITLDEVLVVAGTGVAGYSGDGGLATAAQLNNPAGLEIGPDGSLYIADFTNRRVRRVRRDGVIETIAGNGTFGSTDGVPATEASVVAASITLDSNGGLFISNAGELRYLRPDGIIVTLAGKGQGDEIVDVDEGYPLGQIDVPTVPAFGTVAIAADGEAYTTVQGGFANRQGHLIRLASVYPGFQPGGNFIASQDGAQLFAFDIQGRHLQTLDSLTGEVLYDFGYDGGGWLTSITDSDGKVMTIQRDIQGIPTGILSPKGLLTQLTVNDDLLLTSVSNPEGEAFNMTYDPLANKLASLQNPRNETSSYEFNNAGRLSKDTDSLGGYSMLSQSGTEDSVAVTLETTLGEISTYEAIESSAGDLLLRNTTPAGAVTEIEIGSDGTEVVRRSDGVEIVNRFDPDPRFGANAPLLTSSLTTPDGKSISYSKTRVVTLVDDALLDLATLVETREYGSRTYTRTFDKAARTLVTLLPSGLQQVRTYDGNWRLAELQSPGLAPRTYTYNAEGDVIRIEQDGQFLEFEYDDQNRVDLVRDPANRTMEYTHDSADRLTQVMLPSSRTYNVGYDNNGNRTSIQMPSGATHMMSYSKVDLLDGYVNPTADQYSWVYDLGRRRTQLELPSMRTVDYTYGAGGRVDLISYAEALVDFNYPDATLRLGAIDWSPSGGGTDQTISYGYDGHLVETMVFSGVANGTFAYSYDSDLKLAGIQLDAEPEITSSFNNDGLLVAHGPFTITRDPVSSLPSELSDGTMTLSYAFDALGRMVGRTHELNDTMIYDLQLSYDTSGRLQARTENVMGASKNYVYTYDADEQVTEVQIDAIAQETYGYDDNGNRTEADGVVATFDAADSITGIGATTYTVDDDGFLASRGTDSFVYSSRGELLMATVDGTQVVYTYDGLSRLVARTENGGTTQFLYGNPASPFLVTHSRAPDDTLTTYFYSEAGLLIAFERDAEQYYVAVDQVGSPRVIFDDLGIVKQVTYDAFGVVLSDSNPALTLPIGFGGGIADSVTGLVRFGLRDYAPEAGRWTARDPIMFQGGPNLYMYAGNNPVLKRDPSGLFCTGGEAYAGVGAGIELCYKDGEWSYCTEVGFGAGSGLKINPFGDVAGPEDNLFTKAEVVASIGPVELGGELKTNNCGTSFNPKCGTFLVNCSGEVSADLNDLADGKKVSDAMNDFRNGVKEDGKWKHGLSAKLTAGGCLGSKMF